MWGWPASPRPAGLGIVPSGTDLPLDSLDSLLESVVSCSAFSTWFLGWLASPRPVGLALAHLGPPLLCHVDQELYVVPQVGLGMVVLFDTGNGSNWTWCTPFGLHL